MTCKFGSLSLSPSLSIVNVEKHCLNFVFWEVDTRTWNWRKIACFRTLQSIHNFTFVFFSTFFIFLPLHKQTGIKLFWLLCVELFMLNFFSGFLHQNLSLIILINCLHIRHNSLIYRKGKKFSFCFENNNQNEANGETKSDRETQTQTQTQSYRDRDR